MITKAQINHIKALKNREDRYSMSLFVAEGEKMFEEIVSSTLEIDEIYFVDDKISANTQELLERVDMSDNTPIFRVSPKEMERLSHFKTATPILITVRIANKPFTYRDNTLILALSGIQDPGNLGTIIRLADWFGIEDIICSEDTVDIYNSKVVQASMGAITRVRVNYLSLDSELKRLNDMGIAIYGTYLDGVSIYDKKLSNAGGVIVMGNEGRGISPSLEPYISEKLHIPPYPSDRNGSESLNVAVATAIVCNEFRRK